MGVVGGTFLLRMAEMTGSSFKPNRQRELHVHLRAQEAENDLSKCCGVGKRLNCLHFVIYMLQIPSQKQPPVVSGALTAKMVTHVIYDYVMTYEAVLCFVTKECDFSIQSIMHEFNTFEAVIAVRAHVLNGMTINSH